MTKPLISNAASEKEFAKAKTKQKHSRLIQLQDIRDILKTEAGRRFMWRYLDECGVFRSSYDASGSKVYFNEGMRNIGNQLLADITEASPEVFAQMILQHNNQGDTNE